MMARRTFPTDRVAVTKRTP